MRIFRDFQSNLPSIPVLILPEKFSKNIGGITQYLFTLFAIISVRFFEKKDGETWMRFRRKILEFFLMFNLVAKCHRYPFRERRKLLGKTGNSSHNIFENLSFYFMRKVLENYEKISWFPVQSAFQFSPNFVGKILKKYRRYNPMSVYSFRNNFCEIFWEKNGET